MLNVIRMEKWWYQLQKNEHDITWLTMALFVVLLSIFVNPWLVLFLVYGLFLRAQGQRPKYFFFGPDTKHIPIGVVRDSITRQPIALAVVRLHCAKTQRLIQTKVTDKYGAFECLLPAGEYILQVDKVGYAFPSQINNFGYAGQRITVPEETRYTFFQDDIFLDPQDALELAAQAITAVPATIPLQRTKVVGGGYSK